MSQYNIDIDEQDWLDKYGNTVVECLLWEHSREQYMDDNGEKHHHHIYWATENYEQNGFTFFDEIHIEDITGDNSKLIRPRADKSKEEQLQRTRDKAEVFTPSWVCNAQNNLIDEAWFGRANVFNVADEKSHTWQATNEPIVFPESKTWQDYVSDNRLEVACGEAPYLVSPYDTTTGVAIPLIQRIGLLDRKLRVVNENVEPDEWIKWAKVAVKSTYGFEWQGDNLLLARESILRTVIDYYEDFASKHNLSSSTLQNKTLLAFAYIISWNIFQMDGIKLVLPNSCKESVVQVTSQANLFDEPTIETHKFPCTGCKKNDVHSHTGIYAKVADWAKDDSNEPIEVVPFHSLENMKFNAVVGNPPYQKMDGGAGASAIPIYNHFVNEAKDLTQGYISMIIPSRWMTGGRGLDDFRQSMISDRRISRLFDFYNANECFDNVEIKGGICYFLWDKNHDGPCHIYTKSHNGYEQESQRLLKDGDENIFIRDSKLIQIKNKVAKLGEESFETIVSSMKPYGIRGDFFKNPAKYGLPPIKSKKSEGDITIIGLDERLRRTRRYVKSDYPLPNRELLEDIKLFAPRNYGTGRMGDLPSNLEYAMPFEACTETFVQIGPFNSIDAAKNCEAYMRTKLFTVLVGIRKQDQGAGKSVYHYAPLQDFSIRWTDELLYQKYGISKEEQDYINQIIS